MELQELQEILNTWKQLHKRIYEFEIPHNIHENDSTYAIKTIRECAAYIKTQLPVLKTWCQNYLEEHRSEIFLRYWLYHVQKHMESKAKLKFSTSSGHEKLRQPFLVDWAKYFPMDDFEKALVLVNEVVEKYDIKFCDDEKILSSHNGIPCETNGWFCGYCDDMDDAWHSKLCKIFEEPNIFLNASLHEDFIEKNKHIFVDCQPPKIYYYSSIYSYEEVIKTINKSRNYTKQGQTKNQYIKHMIKQMYYSGIGWYPYYSEVPTNPYDIFFSLWSYIDILPYILEKDLEQCAYIESL